MVTLDNKIGPVALFQVETGMSVQEYLNTRSEDYERSKQSISKIKEEQSKLEESLKAYTGIDEFNLPEPKKPVITEIAKGDVAFSIKSSRTTKKPQYKTAVEDVERHLKGINYLVSTGRAMPSIIKHQGIYFMDAQRLLEDVEVIVAGITTPSAKHDITYIISGDADTVVDLKNRKPYALSERNFTDYVAMDKLKEEFSEFKAAYEEHLAKVKPHGEVTAVGEKTAFKIEETKSEGTNWFYVMNTIFHNKETDTEGDLEIIADPSISLAEKRRQFPEIDMVYHTTRGEKKVYVSLNSVYDRIQNLKNEEMIRSRRVKIDPVEIV